MRKNKNVGKFNTPEKSELPHEYLKNNEEFNEDNKNPELNQKVIEELKKIKKEILAQSKDKTKKDLSNTEKLKILQDYAIKKVAENKILQEKIKQEQEKYREKKRNTKPDPYKNARDKIKKQIRKIEVGYIEYYWDAKSKVYNWIPLTSIPPIITNPKKRELFLLDTPAKFINGKPVFILIKGIPFSIPMDFFILDLFEQMEKMPNLPKDKEGNSLFGRAHLSSTDLYSKYTSIKFLMLFGIRKSVLQSFLIHAFCFILGMMTLYIILSPVILAGD